MRRLAVAIAQLAALGLALLTLLATTASCRTRDFDRSYDATGDCGPPGVVSVSSRSCDLHLAGVAWLPADGVAGPPRSFDAYGFNAWGEVSLPPPLRLADGTPFTQPGGGTGPFVTQVHCRGTPSSVEPAGFDLSCESPDGPVCSGVLLPRP